MPPAVVYSQQESDPASVQRPKIPRRASHAIKIVDPNTNTEVKVTDDATATPADTATAAEFKSKVHQSAVEEKTDPVEEVPGGGASHRPNAIITKPEEGVVPGKGVELKDTEGVVQETEPKPLVDVEIGVTSGKEGEESSGGAEEVTGEESLAPSASSATNEVEATPIPVEVSPIPVEALVDGAEGGKELVDVVKRPSEETGQHEKVEEGSVVPETADSQAGEEKEVVLKEAEVLSEDAGMVTAQVPPEGKSEGEEGETIVQDGMDTLEADTQLPTTSEEYELGGVEQNWNTIADKVASKVDPGRKELEKSSMVEPEPDTSIEGPVTSEGTKVVPPAAEERAEEPAPEQEELEPGELTSEEEPMELTSEELKPVELPPKKLKPGEEELESGELPPEQEELEPEEKPQSESVVPPNSNIDTKVTVSTGEKTGVSDDSFPVYSTIPPLSTTVDSALPVPTTANGKPKSKTPPPAKIGGWGLAGRMRCGVGLGVGLM
jgi:hypothetical protein